MPLYSGALNYILHADPISLVQIKLSRKILVDWSHESAESSWHYHKTKVQKTYVCYMGYVLHLYTHFSKDWKNN